MSVDAVGPVSDEGGPISSSRIRDALREGDCEEAARLLTRPFAIEAQVEHGDKRGRELGYPTANMSVAGRVLPKLGVYAVLVDVMTGPHRGSYRGVASLGVRPMFGDNAPNLETHLFDFAGDLYDAQLSVALVEYLRPEMKFEGASALDDLVAQMRRDEADARAALG